STADTFSGGLGDDTLSGGIGADTYIYNAGDGNDRIYEAVAHSDAASLDKLVLGSGLVQSNTLVAHSGASVTLTFTNQPGSIYIDNVDDPFDGAGIEQVVFGDGTTWSQQDVKAAYITQHETSGNDTVVGFSTADSISGGLGDDTLSGG